MSQQTPISAAVTARVRRYRIERGMSVQALADEITAVGYPVSRATLAKHETGRHQTVPVDLVVVAAGVLAVPVGYLLAEQPCERCTGSPPLGFTCNSCGTAA